MKPILCLDFDGVCHSYSSGWKGADVIPDPPVNGLFEFLYEAKEHFDIQIFSSRSHQEGGTDAMMEWFSKHFTDYMFKKYPDIEKDYEYFFCPQWLSFPETKPAAFASLDDRAITFSGQWPEVKDLKDFRPWHKDE